MTEGKELHSVSESFVKETSSQISAELFSVGRVSLLSLLALELSRFDDIRVLVILALGVPVFG